MSEITVRCVGAQVIMMLIFDNGHKVEVTLDEEEAATLGSLLMGLPSDAHAGAIDPKKPRKVADISGAHKIPPESDSGR
jgi:hypothetical protein